MKSKSPLLISESQDWRIPQVPKRRVNAPRVLSLFSGGGGLDIGFAAAGFTTVASVEIEPHFCKTLEANKAFFGEAHQVICADITTFDPSTFSIDRVDFVIGGPPCQSFSAAGRRAGGVYGINDIRGSLFWHYCRILKYLQPAGFLFENVRGILSANKRSAWDTIVNSFREIGYLLEARVLDAAEYGVPQHRERMIMVGTRTTDSFRFPHPTHGPKGCVTSSYVSALDAIRDLQDDCEVYKPYGGKYEKCLIEIPPGSNYLHFTEKMGHPQPQFAWRSRFSDFLYVASPDKPTKTIVASPGKWAGPFHWKKRRFTIAELKRLFTFPDSYMLLGTEIIKVKQLGNSVPPQIGYALARAVGSQYFHSNDKVKVIDEDFIFHHDERKKDKAAATKRKVIPNSTLFSNNQLDLFSLTSDIAWPKMRYQSAYTYTAPRARLPFSNDISGKHVIYNANLDEGIWSVDIETKVNSGFHLILDLKFIKPINSSFKRIIVSAPVIPDNFLAVLWDAVDECVQRSSSYDNIQKLYGHFTEPYPQFTVDLVNKSSKNSPILDIAHRVCDLRYVSTYHPLSELSKIVGNSDPGFSAAYLLRQLGFDIRTNETNRTIPENSFRICYPFTTPLNFSTYVRWVEKGEHRTADSSSIPNTTKLTNAKTQD